MKRNKKLESLGEVGFWWVLLQVFIKAVVIFVCQLEMSVSPGAKGSIRIYQVLLHFNFLRLFIPLMWKQVGKSLECRKNTSYSVVFSHIRGCQPELEFCLKVFPDAVCILVQRIK